MTQYVIYEIERDKMKEAIEKCRYTFDKVSWENILWVERKVPLYIYTNKEAALKEVRTHNRKLPYTISFYLELESYDK